MLTDIKDTWIGREKHCQTGCSVSYYYDFLGLVLPEMLKLLPVAHKRLRKQNF